MYRIIQNDKTIAFCNNPHYVKLKKETNTWVESSAYEAQAIVINGKFYNLTNHNLIADAPTVSVQKTNNDEFLFSLNNDIALIAERTNVLFTILAESGYIDSALIAKHFNFFHDWHPLINYAYGSICKNGNKLYRCISPHISQEGLLPESIPQYWLQIVDLNEEWPDWCFPCNKQNLYPLKAKVYHNNKYWQSIVDNNIWEPGINGWEEVT